MKPEQYRSGRPRAGRVSTPKPRPCQEHPSTGFLIVEITATEDQAGRLPLVCSACARGAEPDPEVIAARKAEEARKLREREAEAAGDLGYTDRRVDRPYRRRRR